MPTAPLTSLRAPEPSDLDFMLRLENDPAIWTFGDVHAPLSREALMQYLITYDADPLRAGQTRFVITHDGSPVGAVDLFSIDPYQRTAFVGIAVLPERRRAHIAAAALRTLIRYALRHLNLAALAATVSADNTAGMRLFESCGFNCTGLLPAWRMSNDTPGARTDVHIFSLRLQ